MKPSTEHWLLSTISKRLQRIAEGKELMAEDRALTLLGILKDVAGDVPSLDSLPLSTKEWLEAAINSRLMAMEEGREMVEERRIATLTEALAILRPTAVSHAVAVKEYVPVWEQEDSSTSVSVPINTAYNLTYERVI